jgi:hypothetical protein
LLVASRLILFLDNKEIIIVTVQFILQKIRGSDLSFESKCNLTSVAKINGHVQYAG